MEWLEQNGLMLLMLAVFGYLLLWDRIMARILGVENITVHDLSTRLGGEDPPLLVDVRTPREFQAGHVKQAISVPLSELGSRREQIVRKNEGRAVAVICQSGNRSVKGSLALKRAGAKKVYNVAGGLSHWQAQGYTVLK
nr:Rhodanese domain protein [uncultured bacterium]